MGFEARRIVLEEETQRLIRGRAHPRIGGDERGLDRVERFGFAAAAEPKQSVGEGHRFVSGGGRRSLVARCGAVCGINRLRRCFGRRRMGGDRAHVPLRARPQELFAQLGLASLGDYAPVLELEDIAAQDGDELRQVDGFGVAVADRALPLGHAAQKRLAAGRELHNARAQIRHGSLRGNGELPVLHCPRPASSAPGPMVDLDPGREACLPSQLDRQCR